MNNEDKKEIKAIIISCIETLKTSPETNQITMQKDIDSILQYIREDKEWKKNMETKLDSKFVSKMEFSPVKKIVY